MWWKRILTIVTFMIATALTVCVLLGVATEVSAAEVNSVSQIEENQPTTVEAEVDETKPEEANYDIIEYKGYQYKLPHISLNREPRVTESGYVEKYTEVPHYFQSYYHHIRYGDSNIGKSGCGIACVSMVLTYLLDEEVTIEELAQKYFRYKVEGGSSYNLFPDSAEDYGVTIEKQTWNWQEVMTALEEGHVVIANVRAPSIFTTGGHFIVLSGITEDGRILVRDPNLYNFSIWNYPVREDGYANGFEEKSIMYGCHSCWIYEKKDIEAVEARLEAEIFNATTENEENP